MKLFQGIWMPTGEQELIEWMSRNGQMVDGKGTYQYAKLQGALEHCKSFRTAIDQGSHIGLWTMHLAKRFDEVVCFEPVARLRECWIKNVAGLPNLTIHECALGEVFDTVTMLSNEYASGDSYLDTAVAKRSINGHTAKKADTVPMRPLDSFNFIDVDFIKCDAEGYEENILRGAERTITQWKPTIVVEQKRDMARKFGLEPMGAVEYLKSLGYVAVREMGGDFIMVHK